jgi:hypothetical protein
VSERRFFLPKIWAHWSHCDQEYRLNKKWQQDNSRQGRNVSARMAGWETLTHGEASEILDRPFAALDKERERRKTEHHAKKTMKAGAALQTRKGAHHHVNP